MPSCAQPQHNESTAWSVMPVRPREALGSGWAKSVPPRRPTRLPGRGQPPQPPDSGQDWVKRTESNYCAFYVLCVLGAEPPEAKGLEEDGKDEAHEAGEQLDVFDHLLRVGNDEVRHLLHRIQVDLAGDVQLAVGALGEIEQDDESV